MPRTPPPDVIHADILRFFPELVRSLGGDPEALAGRVGSALPPGPGGHSAVSYRQAIEIMERAAEELACPDFGLRLAERQGGPGVYGPLGTVMRHARTFGDALDYTCRHNAAHSLAARVWIKRLPRDEAVFVGHDIVLDGLAGRGQAIEQILMIGHLGAMAMTDGQVRVRRVHFRHQPAMPLASYRRRFGCDVAFGQQSDGAFFLESDLACPLVEADAEAYRQAAGFIEARFGADRPSVAAQVRGLVMQHLGTRHCTHERISADLGLHKRVLHRRLAAEGTSFQTIKDEVRRDLLLYYLQKTDIAFAPISEKLGFAEQSVLTRSCRRWLQRSPSEIRMAAALTR